MAAGDRVMPGPVGAGGRDDRHWTTDDNGVSNSSGEFLELVDRVAELLDNDAHMLMEGHSGRQRAARLIMAHLAHKYDLVPAALIAAAVEQRVRAEIVADLVSARDADQLERRREARDENLDDAEPCEQPDWECHASAALSAWAGAIRVARGVSL